MRNRTELVTTTVEGSENEESGAEDSGEDWQPEKTPGGGRKSAGRKSVAKTPAKRKSTTRASASAKKSKKPAESEPEDEDSEEEPENSEDDDNEEDEDGGEDSEEIARRKRRQISGKNHPDKDGFMELYLFKNDLTKDYREDDKLCLWRRDGASLLQKYLVELNDDAADGSLVFKGSSVYSCWEEKRKSDFFTIKVKVVGDKRDSKVRVEDAAELEKFATEERQPVDPTPNGADPTIESIRSTDDEDDEDDDEEDGEGEMDSEGDGEIDDEDEE